MPFSKVVILLVEDNPDHREIWQAHLCEVFGEKHTCDCVDNLAQAITKIAAKMYDVVLVDLTLPDSSGLATVQRLISLEDHPPVVILTALDDYEIAAEAVQQGAQDFLVKSEISEGLLKKSILYAIERHRRANDLKESNHRYKQFANTVAHELRNPMNVLAMTLSVLEKHIAEVQSAKVNELILGAKSTIAEMANFTNDLLQLASMDVEKEAPESVCIDRILMMIKIALREQLAQSQARIHHKPLPTVLGHATHLRHLLQNLIGNALKYKNDKPAEIHIEVEEAEKEWTFHIRDNGIGIDEKDHSRVFLPLVRLQSGRHKEGTGIGLAYCKQVVEQYGGKIWVKSNLNEGCTFSFTLKKNPDAKE